MSAFTLPSERTYADYLPRQAWPWSTALILFVLFAAANWSWDASQRWYATNSGDVDAMVDRIHDGQLNRQAAFALMGVWGIWGVLLPTERSAKLKLLVAYPIIVFCGWALISVLWSVDAQQTAKRLVVFAAMVLSVMTVVRRHDIREVAQIAFIASLLTVLIGIGNETRILLTDFPGFGKWRFGGTMHPNHAGLNAAILILASLYLFTHSKRKLFLIALAIGCIVLLSTKSRTALMSSATGVVIYILLAARASRAMGMLLMAAWGIAGLLWLSSMDILPDINEFASMGRDDIKKADVKQLTGRTDIWKFAVMQGAKDPNRTLVGYGYETFWTAENARGVSEFVKFKISEGHCVYLDWYLELGLVGVGLYGFILLTSLLRWSLAARILGSPAAAVAAATLAAALIHGFAESSSGDANLPTFFVFASLAAAARLRPDEEEYA